MLNQIRQRANTERGTVLVEFAIAALVFFVAVFSVLEMSRMLWTYNALADGVRRGARYAATHSPDATGSTTNSAKVKNVVVYGTDSPAVGAQPIVYGLATSHVTVTYSGNFGVNLGTATVSTSGFSFQFLAIPSVLGASLTFPTYQVIVAGESAGCVPGVTTTGC
ncbi:MAG: pilus assembly protein [Acidobacteria bacterium]|nr:pilus assembly protein [Acidobacteriota bacterium]MBI3426336.1 pilus assembly protein [Acidobacteriota bacterium]